MDHNIPAEWVVIWSFTKDTTMFSGEVGGSEFSLIGRQEDLEHSYAVTPERHFGECLARLMRCGREIK